jgi:site-specific recombinase XerC
MTELEESGTDRRPGPGALRASQAYRGYGKETMARALAATRKRYAHLLAQKQFEEQKAEEPHQPETARRISAS